MTITCTIPMSLALAQEKEQLDKMIDDYVAYKTKNERCAFWYDEITANENETMIFIKVNVIDYDVRQSSEEKQ